MRYQVKAEISGLGAVQHVVRTTDQVSAWDRILKAYPKREAKVLQIRELDRWDR